MYNVSCNTNITILTCKNMVIFIVNYKIFFFQNWKITKYFLKYKISC